MELLPHNFVFTSCSTNQNFSTRSTNSAPQRVKRRFYRAVAVVPDPSRPLRRQQDVEPSELGAAGQRGNEGRQVFGGEAVSRRRLLQGFLTADVRDLQPRDAREHPPPP